MQSKAFDRKNMPRNADWHGDDLAVTCPVCGKVFLTDAPMEKEGRICPVCGKARAYLSADGSVARLEWQA